MKDRRYGREDSRPEHVFSIILATIVGAMLGATLTLMAVSL